MAVTEEATQSRIQPRPEATSDAALPWHRLAAHAALARLQTNQNGLTNAEARLRLERDGPNELVERGGRSPWLILREQFTSTMVLVLIAAAVLYAAVSGIVDALPIFAIVLLFAGLGFAQEYRAERAMAALKRMAVPTVRVRRGGALHDISARELVTGDIVLLEAGNVVPADARVLESANLRVQEAALTGEAEPVEKDGAALDGDELPLGDRRNMLYMGTVVTYGRGVATVTATGMRTELGLVASMLQAVGNETTPLQRRLDQVGRAVASIAIAVAVLIFVVGLLQGEPWPAMLLTAISVAVAAVPEGLPAVVTITLALGAQRMLRRNALLRKLPAVETLGSVTVICSDKTGTLTENRMTVTVIDAGGHRLDCVKQLDTQGRATDATAATAPVPAHPAQEVLLAGGALCSDAVLQLEAGGERLHAVGDPTEGALVVAAHHFGLEKAELERWFPRVGEAPFDSERKRMSTVHRIVAPSDQRSTAAEIQRLLAPVLGAAPLVVFTKGAVDGLLERATHVWADEGVVPLDDAWRRRILGRNDELAANGIRVLAVALRPLAELAIPVADELERELIVLGLVGIIDPPRSAARDAVATCRRAGIRAVMITGDHALTAQHIARQLGIDAAGGALTGAELERMSDDELTRAVKQVSVFARVSPAHKLRIVKALQAQGEVVAMTGDGVNDAPALKQADIGVAMGITGTDVSKEAADMVLRDDNFATIVAAVEEGRAIYDNLRKFVAFSIAGNLGKVLTVFAGTALLGPLLGMPLILPPLQLLWLNFLTDGLLGLGLGVERPEPNAMRRPPIAPSEGIFGRGLGLRIGWTGVLIGALALGVGVGAWISGLPGWQSLVFTTLATAQIGQALAVRSGRDSFWQVGPFSNPVLLGTAALVLVLQLVALLWSPLQQAFGTVALGPAELAVAAGAGLVVFGAIELEKWWLRLREARALGERASA